jgi:DNA polymerase alpha subunit A
MFCTAPGAGFDLDNILKTLDEPRSSASGSLSRMGVPRSYGAGGYMGRPLPRTLAPRVTTSNQSFASNVSLPVESSEGSMDFSSDHMDSSAAMDMSESAAESDANAVSVVSPPEGLHKAVEDTSAALPAPVSLIGHVKKLKPTAAALKSVHGDPSIKQVVSPAQDLKIMSEIAGDSADLLGPEGALGAPTSGTHAIDPSWWIHKSRPAAAEGEAAGTPPAAEEEYVNMYWLDATEANGVLYLFGKVPVTEPGGSSKYFVSCCVAVYGNERNLFVLPKDVGERHADGSIVRAPMHDVYSDLTQLLVPDIVPRTQGQTFRCKPVKRKYAFEHGDIPRGEETYLKVVYSAKYGLPSASQCAGFRSIERIFGSSSSVLENFLLKRQLMGPSWITIRNPRVLPSSASWCKVEIGVENPKFISRMTGSEAPAAPNLTSLCISMKTVVNPATHTHEIVMLSGLIHTKVDVEADTELHPTMMRRFTLIRPLGGTCGGPSSGFPAVFPMNMQEAVAETKGAVISVPNERALLSMFFSKLLREDPDIIISHNLLGFEFDVLLSRALANKLGTWSQLGRLRRIKAPKSSADRDVAAGRLLCDTYKAAKEFLRETTYSLTHLAQSQLGIERAEIDPVDTPKYFFTAPDIVKLASHTASDAFIVQRLLFKLQVVPLTKQLTNLSGNLWSRTLRGARAERIEYLLLHEFHSLKYILPEKKAFGDSGSTKHASAVPEDEDEDGGAVREVGGRSRHRAKAAYAGGLVLEPKKGLYDTFILLLDFNSLYPSLIQEYNLCFTTVDWTKYMGPDSAGTSKAPAAAGGKAAAPSAPVDAEDEDEALEDDDGLDPLDAAQRTGAAAKPSLPPVPDSSAPAGVLPRVIKTLVDRRRQVKDLLKGARDPALRQQLDIRQKALKLTANSMYGCLGFSFSRFYARPIAALVTAKGREALQRTVDQAQKELGLDVIYGDTDSVMINTNSTDLATVKSLGLQVKQEVNKLYKSLELDIDGIFKSMLLLKKKKYAAVTIKEVDGGVVLEKEMKGLDLVRRDWCPLSKETGRFVVDQILSGRPREEIVHTIHEYLSDLAKRVRGGQEDLSLFVVTKGLNKSPKDYPDCKGQPHLQVALRMLKQNKPVNIGDHIPYVICEQSELPVDGPENQVNQPESGVDSTVVKPVAKTSAADRAFHPDEIYRANGKLTVDYEWYLSQQILPPISRLCEPIEGTSAAFISLQLGLDASK